MLRKSKLLISVLNLCFIRGSYTPFFGFYLGGKSMKSTIGLILAAAVAGVVLGAVLAGVQARPWRTNTRTTDEPQSASSKEQEQTQDTKLPLAKFDETTYHFGSMQRGTTLSHAFKVHNVGGGPLHIEVGSTTCKCTVGDLTNNDIPPGSEGEVVLQWTAKTPPGPFRHGAVLLTDDPTQSRIELTVEGAVVESTALSPDKLYFGNVQAGETARAEVYLMAFLQEDVEILSRKFKEENLAEQISVEIKSCEKSELPNPEARAGVKIVATLHAGRTLGPIYGWLSTETNLEQSPKVEIPLLANVIGDISIFGPSWIAKRGLLRLGLFRSDEGKKTRLNIAIRGEHASSTKLKISSVTPKELQAKLGERHKMNDHLVHVPLTVEVPVGTRPLARRGEDFDEIAEIVLSTTHPQTPELKLRVEFAVQR